MDEGRDTPAATGSRPAIAAKVRLTPVQEAWGAYVQHTTRCPVCRSRDGQCAESERLHRAWRVEDADAHRQLSDT
ncbi:hypothetical protein [Streptomyces coeruleorubidus]|uniref:Uncharacterized protein n=1 Tax=Streptomyces coeruleorubidus TaxID=116188 RepID=A0A5J6I547_STRC4|nr:hypothetical protein [Streptomyces coeruleorubidus]QEV23925.1 hypothetical protein CP976_07055 [Streptomyces coeruleorubidus]GGT86079.1 hypothetical protein GCM10010256_52820 [Streptomyces coeruleorubidus]